ncbi:MAG: lipase maturation factor family protein [Waddliaceae bacterium]
MQALFLKAIALNYFFAYFSLWLQYDGLYGSNGILPIKDFLERFKNYKTYTLFNKNHSDKTVKAVALTGSLISLLILSGFHHPILFLLLFAGYLSFVNVGQDFLSFQWDTLLLEVGFITIFFSMQTPPPFLLTLSYWLLLFRFLFGSGYVKWVYGSREWRDLTAMCYHYETQPLPNRISFFMHQQPKWAGKLSTFLTYVFEMGVPFLYFLPSPFRFWGCVLSILFQLLIFMTGNFGFFNTLTIALCIPLLDLNTLPDWFQGISLFHFESPILTVVLSLIGSLFVALQLLRLIELFTPLAFTTKIKQKIAPFHILNSYGLFVHMTTSRDEITIEGSDDNENWKPYTFKWKPGALEAPPRQVAPYHPRLDWQMWFAALSGGSPPKWFDHLIVKLLQGSKQVLALFKSNPFPDNPPKFIRAKIDAYSFADSKKHRETKQWWVKKEGGFYFATVALKEK